MGRADLMRRTTLPFLVSFGGLHGAHTAFEAPQPCFQQRPGRALQQAFQVSQPFLVALKN